MFRPVQARNFVVRRRKVCYTKDFTTWRNTMAKDLLESCHFRLPATQIEAMRKLADEERLTLSDLMRRALREWLKGQEKKELQSEE